MCMNSIGWGFRGIWDLPRLMVASLISNLTLCLCGCSSNPAPLDKVTLVDVNNATMQAMAFQGQIAGYDESTSNLYLFPRNPAGQQPWRLATMNLASNVRELKLGKVIAMRSVEASYSYGERLCAVSADASRIAYIDNPGRGLYVTETSVNTSPRRIFAPPAGQEIGKSYLLEWLSDHEIIFCYGESYKTAKIIVADLKTETSRILCQLNSLLLDTQLAFSRFRSSVVFVNLDSTLTGGALETMNVSTGERREVARHKNDEPDSVAALAWSPDGNTIASLDLSGQVHLLDANSFETKRKFAVRRYVLYLPWRLVFVGNDRLTVQYNSEGQGTMIDTYECTQGTRLSSLRIGLGPFSMTVLPNMHTIAYGN